ncbi:MAG: hypothetical protein OWT28_05755 [Firmicutes bacterium]|nr:hypothetical protein [Bacillota bacterium]
MSLFWKRTGKMLLPVTAGLMMLGTVAFADMNAQTAPAYTGKLFGNIPNVTVRGIPAGGAPWVVDGSVKLTDNHIWASGKWLMVPKTGYLADGKPIPMKVAGTTAGFLKVVAEITFANAKSVVTAPVTLTAKGDFTINAKVMIPKGAADPVILIGPPNGMGGEKVWFASTNFLMDYGQAMMGSASN